MKCLTEKALFPYNDDLWNSLYRFCEQYGETLSRAVVKKHASSDYIGCFTQELTITNTTEKCGYGFVFGDYALRQIGGRSWEVVEGYLNNEKVVVTISCWSDLTREGVDAVLADAIQTAKAERQARIDAMLASLPDPEPKPEPKKLPKWKLLEETDHDLIDWSDYDEDDDDWDDSYFG